MIMFSGKKRWHFRTLTIAIYDISVSNERSALLPFYRLEGRKKQIHKSKYSITIVVIFVDDELELK